MKNNHQKKVETATQFSIIRGPSRPVPWKLLGTVHMCGIGKQGRAATEPGHEHAHVRAEVVLRLSRRSLCLYSIILKWLLVVQVDKNGAGEGVFSVGVNADPPCVAKGRVAHQDARIPGDLAPGSTLWGGGRRGVCGLPAQCWLSQ